MVSPKLGDDRPDPERLLPRVSPLGILEPGQGEGGSPRIYPRGMRLAALAVLAIFLSVVVVTTALSLGAYCLTTDAGSAPAPRSNRDRR